MIRPVSTQSMLPEGLNQPLGLTTIPVASPNGEQVLVKFIACGIRRTGLHIDDGELL
jgi:Zn-dependent alcohol dehydrogenase